MRQFEVELLKYLAGLNEQQDRMLTTKLREYPVHRLPPYKREEIDLSIARDKVLYEIPGDFIEVTKITGAAYLQFDSVDADKIDLREHRTLETPSLQPYEREHFERFYITNDAQTNAVVNLTIGKEGAFKVTKAEKLTTEPDIKNIEMTLADTEYSQVVPNGTRKFSFWCEDGSEFRFAWVTGKVKTPTRPYGTVLLGCSYFDDNVYLINQTLYFGCAEAGKVVILHTYV